MKRNWRSILLGIAVLLFLLSFGVPFVGGVERAYAHDDVWNGWDFHKWSEWGYKPEQACTPLNDAPIADPPLWAWWSNNMPVLAENFWSMTHPCSGHQYFNWITAHQESQHGTMPAPYNVKTTYTLNYAMGDNGSQGARVILRIDMYWDFLNRGIEMTVNAHNWGDNHPDPRIVDIPNIDGWQYLHIDGAYYGLNLPNDNQDHTLVVDWGSIVQDLIGAGYLTQPTSWAAATTDVVSAGEETATSQPTNAIYAQLMIKGLSTVSKGQQAPSLTDKTTGKYATASNTLAGYPPSNAIDDNLGTLWNAGAFPTQWIQVDLGTDTLITYIGGIPAQYPAGNTTHKFWVITNGGVWTLVGTLSRYTNDQYWLSPYTEPYITGRYVRIETTASPSWVAWKEIVVK